MELANIQRKRVHVDRARQSVHRSLADRLQRTSTTLRTGHLTPSEYAKRGQQTVLEAAAILGGLRVGGYELARAFADAHANNTTVSSALPS
jgi:hypothetical protein